MSASNVDRQYPARPVRIGCKRFLVTSIAEFLGTGTLMFLGCMGCIPNVYPTSIQQLSPFTFGLAVAIAIQMFGNISGGHFNPAITLASCIMGHTPLDFLPCYIVAQLAGGIFGFEMLLLLMPPRMTQGLCVNKIGHSLTDTQGCIIEIVITTVFIMACCAIWDRKSPATDDSASLRLGLMLSTIFIIAGPFTGASTNPARSLPPALFASHWDSHWIYVAGPMIGGVIAPVLYRFIFVEGLSG